jgi:taurine dioxygenase
MNLSITCPDRPIGAFVEDASLADLDQESFRTLRDLVHDRSVVTVRGQGLSQSEQVAFARRFGDLQKIFIKEATALEYPELFFVSNVTENGRPIGSTDAGVFWHTDGAYLPKPHSLSMLYAIEVPVKNGVALGDTLFAGMAAAYDGLPTDVARRIEGLRAVHSLHHRYGTKAGVADMARRAEEFPPVSHPLVVRHPVTGRKCLYVSEGYTTHVEGLPKEESDALLEMLCAHVTSEQFLYRHGWAPGDLVIWDNRATLHRATFDYEPTQRRLMRRATVSGESLG